MSNSFVSTSIRDTLDYFLQTKRVPNIIFHGPSGGGKRWILQNFLERVYDKNSVKMKTYIMSVNCSHGKGIKFIREDLKFFAKTNMQSNNEVMFKSVVLLNADALTIDAQSALRRCIELFSHNTRFFIIVENKQKLLNPIISRFCEIYIGGKPTMIHPTLCDDLDSTFKSMKLDSLAWEHHIYKKAIVLNKNRSENLLLLIHLSTRLYEQGYSAHDLVQYYASSDTTLAYYKLKSEFRYEPLLMFILLKLRVGLGSETVEDMDDIEDVRPNNSLENILLV